jgi:hypothetical protein
MNPSDANSPLATLRQLKEMLDAGTLTPQEFEALKQKLVFGISAAATPAPETPPAPSAPAYFAPPVPAPAAPGPPVAPAYFSPAEPTEPIAPAAYSVPPAPERPDWLAAAAPVLVDHSAPEPIEEEPAYEEELEKRNPLNLIFAIGSALVFLAVVLYLTLGNRGPDEHLTSTTQTAADSTRVAPEIGPQAQQLTLPPASPETIRVAPAVPVPVAPAASQFRSDSAAVAPPVVAPAASKPVAKPAAVPTAVADTAI